MKGMTTCKVCGRDFALMTEEHYVARDLMKKGVIPAISGEIESGEFDVFDCPHCGCQNVMQSRKPVFYGKGECPCDFGICDECDHVGEKETPKHDGCKGCKYIDVNFDDYPCNLCKMNHEDMYEKDEEERDDE